jgi:hypothetical protein
LEFGTGRFSFLSREAKASPSDREGKTPPQAGDYFCSGNLVRAMANAARVIHVTEGNIKATLQSIQQHLENKGVNKEQVEQISMDLSPSFIAGAAEPFPAAQLTFDRFHVVKLLNVETCKLWSLLRLKSSLFD